MSISKASLINKSNNSLMFCLLSGLLVASTLPFNHRYNLLSLLTPPHRAPAVAKLSTGWVLEKDLPIFSGPGKFLGKKAYVSASKIDPTDPLWCYGWIS